jgi:hypothetical protein
MPRPLPQVFTSQGRAVAEEFSVDIVFANLAVAKCAASSNSMRMVGSLPLAAHVISELMPVHWLKPLAARHALRVATVERLSAEVVPAGVCDK